MTLKASRLGPSDLERMKGLLKLFSEVFEEPETYQAAVPSDDYLSNLLGKDSFFVLVTEQDHQIIGGLVAYELVKFEQERSEIYIYDLAVDGNHRRQGVATGLIRHLQELAAQSGAWVVFVQADYVDDPAVALYSKLGVREEVLHFDLPIPQAN